jgi:hypothetical protein
MRANTYQKGRKSFLLGHLINSEIDGMVVSAGRATRIFVLELENGKQVALSERYGVCLQNKKVNVASVEVGDRVMLIDNSLSTVSSIRTKEGSEVVLTGKLFALNGILVTTEWAAPSPIVPIPSLVPEATPTPAPEPVKEPTPIIVEENSIQLEQLKHVAVEKTPYAPSTHVQHEKKHDKYGQTHRSKY